MTLIRGGFVSLTSGPASGDDDAYLRWHLLDHLPEQYTIPGIRLGTRWRADESCVEQRLAETPELAAVRHAVLYLLAEPLEETLTEFAALGRRLGEAGRYPEPATPHLLGAYELREAHAAPSAVISDDALPFRAHRGVYLLVERPTDAFVADEWWAWHSSGHLPQLLETDGVAGVVTFASTERLGGGADQASRFGTAAPWDPGGSLITVVYLDQDTGTTADRLRPHIEARWTGGAVTPRLAGPFRANVTYEAWTTDT